MEEGQKNQYIDEIERQLKETMSKSKNLDQKLKRIKQGKMTDMQKMIKDK